MISTISQWLRRSDPLAESANAVMMPKPLGAKQKWQSPIRSKYSSTGIPGIFGISGISGSMSFERYG